MAAAALIALLAFAPFASAANDPLASGTTTLTLNKGFCTTSKQERRQGAEGESRNGEKPDRDAVGQRRLARPDHRQGRRQGRAGIQVQARQDAVPLKVLAISTAKNFLTEGRQ